MNKNILALLAFLTLLPALSGQEILFKESFGEGATGTFIQSEYAYYDHPEHFAVDTIEISVKSGTNSSSGYPEASGLNFVQMDGHFNWDGNAPLSDTLLITSIDSRGYSEIHLSFGIFNRTGWSGISNHAFAGFYSTDSGRQWIEIDKLNTINGNHFPGNNTWGWVTLGESLPAVRNLQILIVNPKENDHTCLIDDIMVTGYMPDDEPPESPTNLQAHGVRMNSVNLLWDASVDNHKISHYSLLKNGYPYTTTRNPFLQLDHQPAGSIADFSVIAYDLAGNASEESNRITVQFEEKPADHKYSWETDHAYVLPKGELEWRPHDFQPEAGSSIRYIDYEGGNDQNSGLSTENAWKHHPWDINAGGNAALCSGIHTYVFKRGAVYRGKLIARESGSLLEPIRLTSDPAWGTGEAFFFGSKRFTEGWTRADESFAPNIPSAEKVWYRDFSGPDTKYICEVQEGKYIPVRVARSPNYKETPEDPVKSWWEWSDKKIVDEGQHIWLTDKINLVQSNPEFYSGASVYSQEDAWVMCTVRFLDVLEWDPENHRVKMGHTKFGGKGCRYFIENTPFLLDTTSEFYIDKNANRLFIRLANDKDPNTAIVEVAEKEQLIEIGNKHHIEISGLTFGLTTANKIRHSEADAITAIRMTGVCSNIIIKNNKFVYQNGAVSLHNLGSEEENTHNILVADNEFLDIGDLSIAFSSGSIFLDNISIMRNKITNVGFRQLGRQWSSIPAIFGQFNYGEVAGNIIDYSWGNGINIFWGKEKVSPRNVPFVRGLIHHNQAMNTVFGSNDYGGIESWQGGPTYCYNNRSHNSPGYRHYDETSLGYAFYFDGCFKHYVFNNIASGISHERTATSFQQVLGYYNMFVHNTGHNTRNMFDGAPGGLNGHNTYLSNIGEDIEVFFWHKIAPVYLPFDSYGYNIASGAPFKASLEDKNKYLDLNSFKNKLEEFPSQLTHTGWNAGKKVLSHAEEFDFRPISTGEAIDRGVRFFVPFPLAKVVGEWNFYKHQADSSIIRADHLYLTEEFNDRDIYQFIPKNHLKAHNINSENFRIGDLEDWMEGSLIFDGSSVYCSANHNEFILHKSNNLDMTTNDFIIESYIKPDSSITSCAIVSKHDRMDGYELGINESGFLCLKLYYGGTTVISACGQDRITDDKWHHLFVEVDRNSGVSMYIDGNPASQTVIGEMPLPEVSLSNASDFLVGKNIDDQYFKGSMDFLRISRGNLYEAKTTFDELYSWQTRGPFLYDMSGKAPIGKRDAGALEAGEKLCDMKISPSSLEFEETADEQDIFIDALTGFEYLPQPGDIYAASIKDDTLSIFVDDNPYSYERYDSVRIFGCHETQYIPVLQTPGACELSLQTNELTINHEQQIIKIACKTNGLITIQSSSTFVYGWFSPTDDSIYLSFLRNNSGEDRIATMDVMACNGLNTLTIIQKGLNTTLNEEDAKSPQIYPNPASFLVRVDLGEYPDPLTGITIYNALGQKVKEISTRCNEIDVSELSSGLYFIRLEFGHRDLMKKLIKK